MKVSLFPAKKCVWPISHYDGDKYKIMPTALLMVEGKFNRLTTQKVGSGIKINHIVRRSKKPVKAIFVPLFPICNKTLLGIAETVVFAEADGCKSCLLVTSGKRVGVLALGTSAG